MKKNRTNPSCPCGGFGKVTLYKDCCEPFINGSKHASTAEQLMRSRYTAYTLANVSYLLATWHESTRPQNLHIDAPNTPHGTRWLGLQVHSHTLLNETQAQVMFTARYREAGRAYLLKEQSRFVRENELWFYVNGETETDNG